MEQTSNNSLSTRVISATVFTLIFLISLINKYTFVGVFSFFMLQCLWEFYTIARIEKKIIKIAGLIVAQITFLCGFIAESVHINIYLLPILLHFTIIAIEILYEKISVQNIIYQTFGIIYIAIPFTLTNHLINQNNNFEILKLISIFLMIWTFDIFSYFSGLFFGKNKLAPQISPNKTIEGAIGGSIFTIIVSILIFIVFEKTTLTQAILIGLIIALSSLMGDLFESRLKRHFNVKDSGKIMPGHGGLLDRFDSFLFAIIFVTIYQEYINTL